MKKISRLILPLALISGLSLPVETLAGNEDRAGEAGSQNLLINPWARSSGWAGANMAASRGLESMHLNIAGTAFTKKTEILFSNTNWMKGSDISINAFGFTQRVGESGVMSLGIVSMDLGDIQVTTTEQPEGGIGFFSPRFNNIGLGYAKEFSNSIYGGLCIKAISEGIADARAQGVALDAGIQYVTGKQRNVKFGIALKNVGPTMRYGGDGLSTRATIPSTGTSLTVEQRSANYNLPSQLNIGGAYDILIQSGDSAGTPMHRITVAGTFTSHSFTKDQFLLGLEYGFMNYFMVRGGYAYESGIMNDEERTTVLTGPTAGFTLELPLGKGGSSFAIDYSYRATNPFSGSHSIGARLNL